MIESTIVDKYKLNDLTPIEFHNGIFFKRDDLYQPFKDIPLSGGKVRQAISLIANNEKYIKKECNGNIYSSTGVDSPQGVIVTKVAKDFGFNSTVFIGGAKIDTIKKNYLLMNILTSGGRIDYHIKIGYENVLNSYIRKLKDGGRKFFHVKFGINLEKDPESILNSVANQVQNIPKDLDYLVVPCGSCIMLCGILKGLNKYQIYPKNVVGIQISGIDRTKTIESILGKNYFPYKFIVSKDYNYHKKIKVEIGKGFTLDPIYEAKAYMYMINHMKEEIENKKVLFWVVGNSGPVREKVFNFGMERSYL